MSDSKSPVVGPEQAAALMEILQSRGYFHDQGPSPPPSSWKDSKPHFAKEKSCLLETKKGDYATIEYLKERLVRFVRRSGNCTLASVVAELDLDLSTLSSRILDKHCMEMHPDLIQLPDRILTQHYLDDVAKQVKSDLETGEGYLTVSSLAQKYEWTTEECRRFLAHRLAENGIDERRNDKGMFVFVTKSFQSRLESSVAFILSECRDVVHIPELCQENKWEASWIADIVHRKIDELPGIIRGDDFIPDTYRKGQEQTAIDHYTTNGYVTTAISKSVDLLPNQLKSLLQKTFPECIVLDDCIIDYAAVGVPLEALVQEAAEGFAELRPPTRLLDFPTDMQRFVEERVFPNSQNAQGTLTITSERILFVSVRMMNDIRDNLLPDLVDPIVRERAVELDKAKQTGKALEDVAIDNLLSTSSVVDALMDRFSALQVLPHDGDDDILECFVETHLLNDDWREACRNKAESEAVRLEMARAKQTGLIAHISTADVAFEDPSCFTAACHVIQMQNKFLEYAGKVGMTESDRTIYEQEVLQGCCRDFVRRLTLYLLDKHEVEDSEITFEMEGKSPVSSSYCAPVDTATRYYPKLTVKCTLDDVGKERNLAEALTEAVPIQAGKALGELGEAATVKEFLTLAEENCLTICGIPFRKLDKKSEKGFLAHRRQRLVSLLQVADDPCDVLEYTIMLLYQSIKNQVVFGSLLTGPILEQLVHERKISTQVGDALTCLAKSLESCDADLVDRVRACGLAKDVSKHVVD